MLSKSRRHISASIGIFMNTRRLPAVCNRQGYPRVRRAGWAPFLLITLPPLCLHPPLSSHDLFPSFSAPSASLSSPPAPLTLPPLFHIFPPPVSLITLPLVPEGDGERWAHSNAGCYRGRTGLYKEALARLASPPASAAHSAHLPVRRHRGR